jgi:hypothetical protein
MLKEFFIQNGKKANKKISDKRLESSSKSTKTIKHI